MPASKSRIPNGFNKALEIGRPPNIVKLFPNSKALIVSGKVIDRAMIAKGKAMTIAANGRNHFVIRGTSSGRPKGQCGDHHRDRQVRGRSEFLLRRDVVEHCKRTDALCNELGITVPVAIHADHYGIKSEKDLKAAKIEIPSMFDAGITSIAIDASHLPDDQNLLANLALNPIIPNGRAMRQRWVRSRARRGFPRWKRPSS